MLTEEDRAQLAPLLAHVRALRAELALAVEAESVAAELWKEARNGSGWRDRAFGGRFSREPARADAYRNARRSLTSAIAVSSTLSKQIVELERQLDGRIEPVMRRRDARYRYLCAAIKTYAEALKSCRNMRRPIVQATKLARNAAKKTGRNPEDRAAVRVRVQYTKLIARAHSAAGDARYALDALSQHAPLGKKSPYVTSDAVQLGSIPQTVDDSKTVQHLARTQQKLDRAIKRLETWTAQARAAQQKAVQALREQLINDPPC